MQDSIPKLFLCINKSISQNYKISPDNLLLKLSMWKHSFCVTTPTARPAPILSQYLQKAINIYYTVWQKQLNILNVPLFLAAELFLVSLIAYIFPGSIKCKHPLHR